MHPVITLTVEPEVKQLLQKLAEEQDITVSGVVRTAIHEYLASRGLKAQRYIQRQSQKGR